MSIGHHKKLLYFALTFIVNVTLVSFAIAQGPADQPVDDQISIGRPKSKLVAATSTPNLQASTQAKVKSPAKSLVHVPAAQEDKLSQAAPSQGAAAPAVGSVESKPIAPPDPRLKQILETPMPGVGTMPGAAFAKNNVVRVSSERNELVYISVNFPNRISTPYKAPSALGKFLDNEDIVKRVGPDLFVTPANLDPIGISIIGDKPGDPVFTLTLIPKDILGQTIIAQLDTPNRGDGKADIAPSTYVEKLNFLLKQVALGKTPEGYTVGALPKSVARGQYHSITPEVRYSGSSYDIYRYVLTNTSLGPLELKEDIFYTPGVRAVGFFPKSILQTGDETFVLLVHQRQDGAQSTTPP